MRKSMLLIAALSGMVVFAGDTPGLTATVGGRMYTFTLLDGLTAAITGCSPKPTGALVIPPTLTPDEDVWKDGAKIVEVPVSSVEDAAFANCTGLRSVEFPNSSFFFHIRANAFSGCSNIAEIVMHPSLASIGKKAFAGCRNIKEVMIPNSVEEIGEAAFSGCSSITNMVLPFCGHAPADKLAYIENDIYYRAPKQVLSYIFGTEAFDGSVACQQIPKNKGRKLYNAFVPSSLTSLTITREVGEFALRCFNTGNRLEVHLVGSVDAIAPYAFDGCTGLLAVSLNPKITSIGEAAFSECSALSEIAIPDSVISMENRAFANCKNLKKVYVNDLAAWCNIEVNFYPSPVGVNPLSNGADLYVKGELASTLSIPEGVKQISSVAFMGCPSISKVEIPDSITNISYYAFACCSNVESIAVGSGLRSIGQDAFYGCTRLKEVHISDVASWNKIKFALGHRWRANDKPWSSRYSIDINTPSSPLLYAQALFIGDNPASRLTIPVSVERINDYAFMWCTNINSIAFHRGIKEIGSRAFANCSGIRSLSVGADTAGEININSNAFENCSGLENVTLGDGVANIGYCAFQDCTNLYSVSIGDMVTNIGHGAFFRCSRLYRCKTGNRVRRIGDSAFWACMSLTDFSIPSSVTYIGKGAFNACVALPEIVIPYGMTTIENECFQNCCSATRLALPTTVTNIGDYAFNSCVNLTKVEIPQSVTCLHAAFGYCSALLEVVFRGNCPVVYGEPFYEVASGCTAYVPRGSTGWGVDIPGTWNGIRIEYYDGDGPQTPDIEVPSGYSTYSDGTYTWVWRLEGGGVCLEGFYDGKREAWVRGVYPEPSGRLVIPATVNGLPVVALDAGLCEGCDGITSAEIPNTVERIGMRVFCDTGIKSVQLPDSIRDLGDYAFLYTPLESVNVPRSLEHVGGDVFYGTPWQEAQGEFAFFGDGNLVAWQGSGTQVVVPDTVRVICSSAFYGCEIESVVIPASVVVVDDSAFMWCDSLKTVSLRDGVMSIGRSAFYGCTNLTSVTIPKSVNSIGDGAFPNAGLLKTVYVFSGDEVRVKEMMEASGFDTEGVAFMLPSAYTIAFDPGGRDVEGSMASQLVAVGKVAKLNQCGFVHPSGKKFAGWRRADNDRRYDDGVMVFDLAAPGEVITMTAIWE